MDRWNRHLPMTSQIECGTTKRPQLLPVHMIYYNKSNSSNTSQRIEAFTTQNSSRANWFQSIIAARTQANHWSPWLVAKHEKKANIQTFLTLFKRIWTLYHPLQPIEEYYYYLPEIDIAASGHPQQKNCFGERCVFNVVKLIGIPRRSTPETKCRPFKPSYLFLISADVWQRRTKFQFFGIIENPYCLWNDVSFVF